MSKRQLYSWVEVFRCRMLILIGGRILLTNLNFQSRNAKITRFWNRVHLTFNKIISPTKCFHFKELDSMSLPLISFLFYYILGRYFCNGPFILLVESNRLLRRSFNKLTTYTCLLYTSDAADEEDSVDLGGRRIIKKKK